MPQKRIWDTVRVGRYIFGKNKNQEAFKKYQALKEKNVYWHCFGHSQINKIKDALKFADMIHSVDRFYFVVAKIPNLLRSPDYRLMQDDRSADILI